MRLETRVGYATVSAIKDKIEPYLRAHIVHGRYVGDMHYLVMYDRMKWYLKDQLLKEEEVCLKQRTYTAQFQKTNC